MADENTYNETPTLDEIVFENRNRAYGAYDLRTRYRSVLTKAFILGTILFLVVAIAPFVVMKIKQMNEKDATEVNAKLIDILPEEVIIEQPKEEEPPPPPPPKEPEVQEVIQNVVPEPVKAPKVETPPPPISKQLETTTGVVAVVGVKQPAYSPPPPPPGPGKVATIEVKQVSETQIYTEVEQISEFPGGINAFRSKVQSNFDTSVMAGDGGVIKGTITFVVERDGSITDVKSDGQSKDFNLEAVRTVKSIKNKWSPAKVNGKTVRSRYRLPLAMQFE